MKHSKTNISKLVELYGISEEEAEKTLILIEDNLPKNYSSIVQDLAKENGFAVTKQKIREIKGLFRADLEILSLIVELCQINQKEKESKKSKLKELLAS